MVKKSINLGDKIIISTIYCLLVLVGITMIYPFIYTIAISFNDGADAMKGGIYLWPRVFSLDNYLVAFKNQLILNSFIITILRTAAGIFATLFLTAMTGYALSKRNLPGRSGIVFYFFLTTVFNGGFIPLYILLRGLGLYNNFLVYILLYLIVFFHIVLIRTFFESLPQAYVDSATIDGCGDFGVLIKIFIPLSGPILATLALFIGVGHWNDWFTGAFFVRSKNLIPAATLLQQLIYESSMSDLGMSRFSAIAGGRKGATNPEVLRMAFVVLITFPIICLYPFLQKYFVKGVMIGSIKG